MTDKGRAMTDNISNEAVNWITVQNQLFEIKGILNTIVAEHARRLTGLDVTTRDLRNDLTIVKENTSKDIATLRTEVQTKWEEGAKQGNLELNRINLELTKLENGRKENREDIQEIREKANQTWPRTMAVLSLIATVGMFVLSAISRFGN